MNLGCQACKKQPATVHLTDITPTGEKRERHLCDECAQQEGVLPKVPATVPVSEILSGLVLQKNIVQQLADLACPHCKLTFVEFRNSGLLGCPHDYEAFEKALLPLIERAHEGAGHHIGKTPHKHADPGAPGRIETDLIKLRKELNRAVDDEQYEEAARIRDRISTLEKNDR